MGKRHKAKSRGHREGRSDELAVQNYQPVTYRDLQQLQTVRQDLEGPVEIKRRTIANFLSERDILIFVAESARWLIQEVEANSIERTPKDFVTPTQLEKAIGATRAAVKALDGMEPLA
jgi:hypothetical protein